MKRFLSGLALAASLVVVFLPDAVSAQALWQIDGFRSDVQVRADGVVEVKETVDADFTSPRHGIYRYVPYRGTNDRGGQYLVDIKLVGITRDGQPEPYAQSRDTTDVQWKIGDADRTLTGTHEYVITYDVTGALGAFEGFDEIYWNATGDGWDVPLPAGAAASVTLPPGVAASQSACYTGPYGSTATDCKIDASTDVVRFVTLGADEPMTIAVGFPKGSVPILKPASASPLGVFLRFILPILLPIATAVVLLLYWRRKGKDAKFDAIVAQYEPPDGLRPAQLKALMIQGFGNGVEIAPTIIDLAVRGYIRIEETSGFLGIKDYTLHLQKAYAGDAALKPYEALLLDGLFKTGEAGASVAISSLRTSGFSTTVMKAGQTLSKSLMSDGYVDAEANRLSIGLFIGGFSIGFGALIFSGALRAIGGDALIVSVVVCGILCGLFGRYMAKWTDKGHDAAWQVKGYKEFISKVEKYRAPWMETQAVFEKALPYALAFGLGKKWAKAFEHVAMTSPSWYASADAGAWSAMSFQHSMQSFSSTFATRSGTAGSGGGGSSGGGGGGGGGGSW